MTSQFYEHMNPFRHVKSTFKNPDSAKILKISSFAFNIFTVFVRIQGNARKRVVMLQLTTTANSMVRHALTPHPSVAEMAARISLLL